MDKKTQNLIGTNFNINVISLPIYEMDKNFDNHINALGSHFVYFEINNQTSFEFTKYKKEVFKHTKSEWRNGGPAEIFPAKETTKMIYIGKKADTLFYKTLREESLLIKWYWSSDNKFVYTTDHRSYFSEITHNTSINKLNQFILKIDITEKH